MCVFQKHIFLLIYAVLKLGKFNVKKKSSLEATIITQKINKIILPKEFKPLMQILAMKASIQQLTKHQRVAH
jgi:hypothetical protein